MCECASVRVCKQYQYLHAPRAAQEGYLHYQPRRRLVPAEHDCVPPLDDARATGGEFAHEGGDGVGDEADKNREQAKAAEYLRKRERNEKEEK